MSTQYILTHGHGDTRTFIVIPNPDQFRGIFENPNARREILFVASEAEATRFETMSEAVLVSECCPDRPEPQPVERCDAAHPSARQNSPQSLHKPRQRVFSLKT